ncbi:MAG: DUF4012 domain-containing protein [Actinobacteria bacterium]|nr:DUF4012 domain-containing protein [Actinomycetota bacterium]
MSRRRGVALGILIVGLWAAFAAWLFLKAALDLRAGKEAIDAARNQSSVADLIDARPVDDLRRAQRRLTDARRRLGSGALAPVRALPVVGRQIRSLSALSEALATITAAGAEGVTRARSIVDRTTAAGLGKALATRELAQVAFDTLSLMDSVDLGPERGLLGPIARARDEIADELAGIRTGLRRGAAGGRALATLLQGPRRYLVLAANNAEMRAGSGMFLQVGELETNDGALRLVNVRTVTEYPVPPEAVALEGDVRDRWGWLHPNHDWRNLMLSPRFDIQAPLAARMWAAAGHLPVDGVLALDPVAFSGVLQASGPVEVGGRAISATSVVGELVHDQYLRYTSEETEARREGLGELARAVFDSLDRGGWSVAALARGMQPVIDGRHVLAWSARPEDQADWAAAGLDGALQPDSLLIGLLNRGGNKLDYFQRVSSNLAVAHTTDVSLVTVRVTLNNAVPAGEPAYVVGDDITGEGEGAYLGILAVSVPGVAENVQIEGVDELALAGSDGPTKVVGFQLVLRRGETRTVVVRFQLPGSTGGLRVEPSARVPGIDWTAGGGTWRDSAPRLVTWAEEG